MRLGLTYMRRRRGTRAPCHGIASNVTPTAPSALYATRGGGPGGLTIIAIPDLLGGAARCVRGCRPNAWDSMVRRRRMYSPGDALNAILNYWVEELRMNYVALAIALG